MKLHVIVLLLSIFYFSEIRSRPISYPGGWTIMHKNELQLHSINFHYSPSHKYSVGYISEYLDKKNYFFNGIKTNYLLKRINTNNSQSNIYLKNSLGTSYSNYKEFNEKLQFSYTSGIALDWETRRYFTMYENRYSDSGEIGHLFHQKLKIGIAPYLGNYGDLHTWAMIQLDHTPNSNYVYSITPMLRFFKDTTLFEIGINTKLKPLINLTIRF